MLEGSEAKEALRSFITLTLIHNPDYPLDDDEPLLTGGLIDLASLEELAEYIEESFGVHIDEAELSTENVDTLQDIIDLVQSRLY